MQVEVYGREVFVFVNEMPPIEAIRSAHPGTWWGRAAAVTLGPVIKGYDLWIHPWTKITDSDYRQDRVGPVKLNLNHRMVDFSGDYPLKLAQIPQKLWQRLPAFSQEEVELLLSESQSLLDFHLRATACVVRKLNPNVRIVNMAERWEKWSSKYYDLLEAHRCLKKIRGYYQDYEYPDTPGCFFLLLVEENITHHISGVGMWWYLQSEYGSMYARKLVNLLSEVQALHLLPIYIYPPVSISMKQVTRNGEFLLDSRPPVSIQLEVSPLPFKEIPSQYTLLL